MKAKKLNLVNNYQCYNISINPNDFYFDYSSLEQTILALLSDIPKPDLIIFDNLPFYQVACQYRSMMYANFYWHYVLPNYQNTIGADQFNHCLSVISLHAGTSLFCMSHVDKLSRPYKTNPFSQINPFETRKKRTSDISILLSIGLSERFSIALSDIKLFCELNAASTVFIEPKLFSSFHGREPPNCQIAGYSPDFYSKYDLAIIRPGLGTSLELIRYNVPSISVYEPENLEMRHNSLVLSSLSSCNKNCQYFTSTILNDKVDCPPDSNLSQLEAFNKLSGSVKSYSSFLETLIHEI